MRGLLSLLSLAAAVAALCVLLAFALGPPERSPTSKNLEQPVEARSSPTTGSARPRPHAPPQQHTDGSPRLEVTLELEEGEFEILPASLGKSIRIEADYDETFYRLLPTYGSEGGRFDLVFEHRGRFRQLRSLIRGRRSAQGNRVRVHLPAGVPMDLSLRIRRGQAVVDLSGLMLRSLAVDHAMGETEIHFEQPNPIEMETLDLHGRMGELTVAGLGHAAARTLVLDGQMGDYRLEFGGRWRLDTNAVVHVTMGDAQLRVPPEVELQVSGRKVLFGGFLTDRDVSPPEAERRPEARRLVLDAAVRLGDLKVR